MAQIHLCTITITRRTKRKNCEGLKKYFEIVSEVVQHCKSEIEPTSQKPQKENSQ